MFLGLFVAAGALVTLLVGQMSRPEARGGDLTMFCAAGMRVPVEEVRKRYEDEYGVKVDVQYEGSGTLLGKMVTGNSPDIFLAADPSFTEVALEKGLVAETMPVCSLRAGIAVAKGNPLKVASLADLLRDEVRVGIGNPEAASVGRLTREVIEAAGIWESLEPKLAMKVPTVNELANAAKLGTVDAAVVWDSVAAQYPELEFVSVPEFDAAPMTVTVAVTTAAEDATAALRFCRYLTARDRGLEVLRRERYEPVEGDKWSLRPELTLFAGAMLRPAIEDTVARFQEREGVVVNAVYNGCGILVDQMESGKMPDAYFSCDVSFMEMVGDRFGERTTVSSNEMVILVKKGNPSGIGGPGDLAREGVRVGLAHPTKSALGKLTREFLEREGIYEAVRANLLVESPTGDFLVNQLRAGSLDAAVVYRSNAEAHPETMGEYEIVAMGGDATAEQPFAVALDSEFKTLSGRLFEALVKGRESFEGKGFRWRLAR